MLQLRLCSGSCSHQHPTCQPCSLPQQPLCAAGSVVTGSHCDAIAHAGMYDGTLGVIGGIAAIKNLQEAGFKPQKSIEVLLFTSEEPTRFGLGCIGRYDLHHCSQAAAYAGQCLQSPSRAFLVHITACNAHVRNRAPHRQQEGKEKRPV